MLRAECYINARYYDPLIGRFISPDTVGIKQNNPQTLNRYTYCFNNPLTFNDPTGQWPDFTGICKAVVNTVKAAVNTSVNVAKNVVETAKVTVENAKDKANEVQQAVVKKADQTVDSIITHAENAVGIESISTMNTSLVQNVPVINVIQDSLLDNALFFTNYAVTVYPIGVFTKQPMNPITKEEEGYHWNDQKNSNSVAGWYADYITRYGMNLALYGGNDDYAYKAVSYEQDAKSYAANQAGVPYTPPPSYFDYWWDEIFGP